MFIIGCEGCGESSWDKPLMAWNLKRVKLAAVDKPITVCGVCMDRFKHKKVTLPSHLLSIPLQHYLLFLFLVLLDILHCSLIDFTWICGT